LWRKTRDGSNPGGHERKEKRTAFFSECARISVEPCDPSVAAQQNKRKAVWSIPSTAPHKIC
jgi:hypothetical protein